MLDHPFILGPMAGVTDLPFRLLCKEQGAGLVCTEMVSAKAILFHNKNTDELMRMEEAEQPVSLQLFGSEPEILAEAARQIEHLPFAILDLNMGCPVPKIVKNQEGSALLRTPKLIEEIVSTLTRAIRKPVTVKIRIGIDGADTPITEIAKRIEAAGASALAVHGRTREQYYSGQADWQAIAQVKEVLHIPVIGNGDVIDAKSARRMQEQTGCDGVMIGRAARGNPWIFRELTAFQDTGVVPERPSIRTLCDMILRHAQLLVQYDGELMAIRKMRKHVAWYTAGIPHSALIRREVNKIETYDQLQKLLEETLLHAVFS